MKVNLFLAMLFFLSFRLLFSQINIHNEKYDDIRNESGDRNILIKGSPGVIYGISSGKDSFNIQSYDPYEIVDVIVEFKDTPFFVAKSNVRFSGNTVDPQTRLTQFTSDLSSLYSRQVQNGNSALGIPSVIKQFHKLFSGLNIKIPQVLISPMLQLEYVKNIYRNSEVSTVTDENIRVINADKIWNEYDEQGDSIVVGIIDTGIDYYHTALGGGIGNGYKVRGGYDFVNNDSDPMDDHGHGTHVAGIIAADGTDIKGVAPKALLYAFKVLNQDGNGTESDIVDAIERTVDPNNDGNYNDMLDVVNMSLGGSGSPDDPMSTAVNNAVRLGVTFCIAAGNSYNYSTIGSPGTSEMAITVGATDIYDNIASFSSKGPSPQNFAIKPEVLAPGVNITSTFLNNSTMTMNGTSMATPHVAGVCALLKKLHPGWSPEEIKSALCNSAKDLNQHIMAQGCGRIDAWKAANIKSLTFPALLNFGFDNSSESNWIKIDTITLTNNYNSSQNYSISTEGAETGISLTASEYVFSIPPGGVREIIFTFTVSNNILLPNNHESMSYCGRIEIKSTIDTITVPWAFIKGAHLVLNFDKPPLFFYLVNKNKWFSDSHASFINALTADMVVPEGFYSLMTNFWDVGIRYVIRERLNLHGLLNVNINSFDAKNKVSIFPVDENGTNIFSSPSTLMDIGFYFPDSLNFSSLSIFGSSTEIFSSDFSTDNKMFVGLMNQDFGEKKALIIQFDMLKGLNSNIQLKNESSDFVSQNIRIRFNPFIQNSDFGFPFSHKYAGDSFASTISVMFHADLYPVNFDKWEGKIYLTPKKDPNISYTTRIMTDVRNTSGMGEWFTSDAFEIYEGKIGSFTYSTPTPDIFLSPDNGWMIFGEGPVFNYLNIYQSPTTSLPDWYIHLRGQYNEFRDNDYDKSSYAYYNENNVMLDSGTVRNKKALNQPPGKYRLEVSNPNYMVGNTWGKAITKCFFNSNDQLGYPPLLTSLQVRNSIGMPSAGLVKDETAALRFSATCYYSQINDSTKVFVKKYGETFWNQIDVKKETINDFRIGNLYSADLSQYTGLDSSGLDIKISLKNTRGGITEFTLEPAVVIGAEIKGITPVELTTFNAAQKGSDIEIKWSTATETNNAGFEIERKITAGAKESEWIKIGYVGGAGTSSSPLSYSYRDQINGISADNIKYRLKQIDYNGTYCYSDEVFIEYALPLSYELFQNYPNPFNPATIITYQLPEPGIVTLKIFNLIGEEVRQLVNEFKPEGKYSVEFNSGSLASGIYLYELRVNDFIAREKMLILK